jgi:3-oxoacyl-[acyl-carrier protein] reductase
MFNFRDKVVLVTGGSRGIGKETSKRFARFGATVIVNYLNNKKAANSLMLEIGSMGGHAVLAKCDVSDANSVKSMVHELIELYGRIDILVNNAGIWEPTPAESTSLKSYRRTLNVNLDGMINCCANIIPNMKQFDGGHIINISSTAGQRGEAGYSVYAASKGAVISYTKSLAVELAPYNIFVNCVAPGWVDTEMISDMVTETGPTMYNSIPLKRAGRSEEIAWPILFLASSYSSYITGEVLNVNGGSVLCG